MLTGWPDEGKTSNSSENDDDDDDSNNNCTDEGAILLRTDSSEFTSAELEALYRINVGDDGPPPVEGRGGSSNDNSKSNTSKARGFSAGGSRQRGVTLRQILPREGLVGGTDSMADAVLATTTLHVEDRGLHDTTLLECFLNITHLYLQHNDIVSLDGVALLTQLTVLVVHHNAVETLRPLAGLGALRFLDARENAIAVLDPALDLPRESLQYLALLGNPCCGATAASEEGREAYRQRIIACCPRLEMLDDVRCQPSSSTSSCGSDEEKGEEAEEKRLRTPPPPLPVANEERRSSGGCIARSRLRRSVAMSKPLSLSPPRPASVEQQHATATDRLCQQFQHRSGSIRQIAKEHALWVADEEGQTGWVGDSTNGGSEATGDSGQLPPTLAQERRTKTRLYADIHFALETDNARAQQLLGGVWEDVDKVLRTRKALVNHRRERMESQRQQHSSAYAESIALLQKENHTKDLEKYRK
ncbi:putative leucine-rich repeat protein (LRRP) [Trypanosoma grayi]|uniref:putative leucine-rich repeat protein (LRRP) n=1 Tax=Trypanosoma grayi TaxID=71804 RepID=UPI0004F44C90|nr:putative leucine-rich repeat protein (LRRP) [Trypanosoma grayi]KEG06413.1 putative leucine-rich repeat protein (LRRP) [Trypanosoma grayi]